VTLTRYLNRRQQAEYLKARGLKITPDQLAKHAHYGAGPKYRIWGNQAVSTPEWLDEWVEEKLTEPRRSTSETEAA
jgi:hypothetical protein